MLLEGRYPFKIKGSACPFRTATVERKTRETTIRVTVNLDGGGRYAVSTGIGFLAAVCYGDIDSRGATMPKGPNGEKRPADVIGAAIMVARIATGEIEEDMPERGRQGGLKGGKARANRLTPEQRSEIARAAASARWKNPR